MNIDDADNQRSSETPADPGSFSTWGDPVNPAPPAAPPPNPASAPPPWPAANQNPQAPPPGAYYPPNAPYGGPPPPYPPGYGAPGYGGTPPYFPESANGGLVLALGIASVFVLQIILGPIALFLGQRGIRLIDEGRANPADRANINVGRICGLIGTVIGLTLVTIFAGSFISSVKKSNETLAEARAGFKTNLRTKTRNTDPLPNPPAGFKLVRYHAPLGDFPAILADPEALGTTTVKGRHPAIIWLVGGFSNGIGDNAWAPTTPDDDQSGSAFYKAGMVEMYPSLRGGNNNPGYVETCFGEVDDVLAAEKFLAAQPNVDPTHIYLGGHSTGGTLTLLTDAASTGQFRAAFAFGAVADTADYGQDTVAYNVDNDDERKLRAPNEWLKSIKTPTYVIEGDGGNIDSLRELRNDSTNSLLHFIEVPGSDHFGELSRTTPIVAQKIMADTGSSCKITISSFEWLPAPPSTQ